MLGKRVVIRNSKSPWHTFSGTVLAVNKNMGTATVRIIVENLPKKVTEKLANLVDYSPQVL